MFPSSVLGSLVAPRPGCSALPERGKRDGSGEKGRAQGERTEHDGQSVLLVHASVQVAVPQVPAK